MTLKSTRKVKKRRLERIEIFPRLAGGGWHVRHWFTDKTFESYGLMRSKRALFLHIEKLIEEGKL